MNDSVEDLSHVGDLISEIRELKTVSAKFVFIIRQGNEGANILARRV